jgi:hypothetical protein
MTKEKKVSAREKILKFLLKQFPNKVSTKDLQKVAGISDYQRRIRELKAAGWQLYSHLDDRNLKPGEYRLASKQRNEGYEFAKTLDARTRALVLQRNGFTCQACGRGLDDEDPTSPGRSVRLHIDHVDPNGGSSPDNLRVLCSACNQGKQHLILQQTASNLLSAIRRASRKDQLAVYEWLKKHFPQQS